MKNSKSSHATAQSSHRGFLKNFKVPTHHNTESTPRRALKTQSPHATAQNPTHRGTLNFQSPHTPQHMVYTHGSFKTQSPHTPQHRAHTNGNFENSKSSHATSWSPHTVMGTQSPHAPSTGHTHRGTLKTPSPNTPQHSAYTQRNSEKSKS